MAAASSVMSMPTGQTGRAPAGATQPSIPIDRSSRRACRSSIAVAARHARGQNTAARGVGEGPAWSRVPLLRPFGAVSSAGCSGKRRMVPETDQRSHRAIPASKAADGDASPRSGRFQLASSGCLQALGARARRPVSRRVLNQRIRQRQCRRPVGWPMQQCLKKGGTASLPASARIDLMPAVQKLRVARMKASADLQTGLRGTQKQLPRPRRDSPRRPVRPPHT